ncbi:MAG: hypothetical protein ABH881_03090 [bacterium]
MEKLIRTIAKFVLAPIVLTAIFAVQICPLPARAQTVPFMLNFSGKVTTTAGGEIADGNYDFVFSLYASSTSGTAIWTETLNAANMFSGTISAVDSVSDGIQYTYSAGLATTTLRVGQYLTDSTASDYALIVGYGNDNNTIIVASTSETWTVGDSINNRPRIEGGIVDVNLGSVEDISTTDFSDSMYLEITFNGELMQPRKLTTSFPYAFYAMEVGGKREGEFATLSEDETVTGAWSFNNIVDIATSSSDTALTVTQNGSGNIAEFLSGATSSMIILNSGYVGVGTSTPLTNFVVYGDALLEGADRYLNFGYDTGTSGYGFRDSAGAMQYKDLSGSWINIDSLASSSGLVELGDAGQIAYYAADGTALSGTSTIFMMPNGNVGIGTTTPAYTLDVYGNTRIDGALTVNYASTTDLTVASDLWTGTLTAATQASTTNLIVSGSSTFNTGNFNGYLGVGSSTPFTNFTVAGNMMATGMLYDNAYSAGTNGMILQTTGTGYNWVATSTLGLYDSLSDMTLATGNIYIGDASNNPIATSSIYMDTNGNVGIGNISPSYKLDVGGFINTNQYSGYKQAGNTILYASSTNKGTFVGEDAGKDVLADGLYNTFIGYQAGYNNTTGSNNSAIGYNSLHTNTTGSFNLAMGSYSLSSNTTGSNNSAMGVSSLLANTIGKGNSAMGRDSLVANTEGDYNTAMGYNSLYTNTTGSSNSAIGNDSLRFNTTGSNNSAVGRSSLYSNTTGSSNLAVGYASLPFNTTGSDNSAMGYYSLYYNISATSSVAIGAYAAQGSANYSNQNGVYIGYRSGYAVQTGSDNNTFLGYQSGLANTTGANNLLLGYQAGDNITTGSNNIIIGYDVDASSTASYKFLNIGDTIYGDMNAGYVGIGTTSPQYKLDVAGVIASNYGPYGSVNGTIRLGGISGPTEYADIVYDDSGYTTLTFSTYYNSLVNAIVFKPANTERFRINGEGPQSVGVPFYANNNSGPGFVMNSAGSYYGLIQNDAADKWSLGYGASQTALGTPVLTWAGTGNIGIGTTTPFTTFTVAGNMMATGMLYDNTYSAGTNGMVLQTTGTGYNWVATSTLGLFDSLSDMTLATGNIYIGDASNNPTATSSLYMATNGYVGIGTESPDVMLHISKSTNSSSYGGYPAIVIDNANTDGYAAILFSRGAGSGNIKGIVGLEGTTNNFYFRSYGNLIEFQNNLTAKLMVVDTSNGNVGIGSDTTPDYKLDVQGTFHADGVASFDSNVGIGTTSPLSKLSVQASAGVSPLNIASSTGASMLYVNEVGNVGIGTTTPQYALDVDGFVNVNQYSGYKQAGNTILYASSTNKGIFVGEGAGKDVLADGLYNTFIGYQAGYVATSSDWNTGIGYQALYSNTTGSNNTALGYHSLYSNTTGTNNTALGPWSLRYNTTGSQNSAVGRQSLYFNTSATSTIAIGTLSAQGSATYSNQNGVYVGYKSGYAVETGSDNNTFVGYQSGLANTTGANNLLLGYQAGDNITTGSNNIIIGYGVDATSSASYKFLNIGDTIYGDMNAGYVGIGTTTPIAKLNIYQSDGDNTDTLFAVSTSTGIGFKVMGNGEAISDVAFNNAGADYAEYFRAREADLKSGEVVCVDITENNMVKRCDRGADSNVMGIVSTKPAIIGNRKEEYVDNDKYVIVGMLGQVPAKVSSENGEIRPGDSLTSASSTPGYVMKAGVGDPTVGVALESFSGGIGEIKVLISRRNKSLTVEAVEAQITERIASMEIEDEVQILISNAVNNLNLDQDIKDIAEEQIALFDQDLSVRFDAVNGQLVQISASADDLISRVGVLENSTNNLNARMGILEAWQAGFIPSIDLASSSLPEVIKETAEGNIKITNIEDTASSSVEIEEDVAIVEIITATSTNKTALVVNQGGDASVADFQAGGISIVNIAQTGQVTVVGEMLVDGRIMVCSGGVCGSELDNAVDETMGDMGVEGTIVAGAFESVCDDGYVWVPGSAKYGTMPGFCAQSDEARAGDGATTSISWVNVSQGEAALACLGVGEGYHLLSENEWLTIAENIIRTAENDADVAKDGLQLWQAAAVYDATDVNIYSYITANIYSTLSNGNMIYNIIGGVGEWTDQTITKSGIVAPMDNDWQEYSNITDYKGLNIAPPYYYNSANGIGKIKSPALSLSNGDNSNNLRGFVRGEIGLYDLNLSYSPTEATSTVGFRCAK